VSQNTRFVALTTFGILRQDGRDNCGVAIDEDVGESEMAR
jgi:hypothetical protein